MTRKGYTIKNSDTPKGDKICNQIAIDRLTALWALNECGLGGVMHAFKMPFTGIIVGGISVLLITFIALYASDIKTTLLKALMIVLLVKAGVSPYTPIAAYFAVSFQAFLGIFLYSIFSINNFSVILLGAITLLESALQKIIVLTIIFGKSLWQAIDLYLDWVNSQLSFASFTLNSSAVLFAFLGIYFISGILIGILIIRTVKMVHQVNTSHMDFKLETALHQIHSKKNKRKSSYLFLILLSIILVPIIYYNHAFLGWQKAIYLITRSVLILIIWYSLLGPFLMGLLNNFLSKKKKSYQTDLNDVLKIFPSLKAIVFHAWKDCKSFKGWNRLSQFLARSISYSLSYKKSEE